MPVSDGRLTVFTSAVDRHFWVKMVEFPEHQPAKPRPDPASCGARLTVALPEQVALVRGLCPSLSDYTVGTTLLHAIGPG